MKRRWWWLVLLLCMQPMRPVHAADGAGFTMSPELPANQLGGNTGWFNLLVKPGVEQPLTVVVGNQSGAAKRLRLELTNAYTQVNGQVGYAPNAQHDASAATTLVQMGSKPVVVDLPAHTGKKVTFTVTPPQFAGQVLGAIYAQALDDAGAESSSGLAVTNEFAMVVAVQLQTGQTLVPPALRLTAATPKADGVVAHIQNPAPRLFGQLTYHARLTAKGSSAVLAKRDDQHFQMAPNSSFDYPLPLAQPLAPGTYTVTIDATAGKASWHLTRDFTLSAAAVAAMTPETQPTHPSWLWLAGAGVLAIVAGAWLWRRRKQGGEAHAQG